MAIWHDALHPDPPRPDSIENGWTGVEGSTFLSPTVIPQGTRLAPDELIREQANLECARVCQLPYLAHYFVYAKVVYFVMANLKMKF